MIDNPIKKCGSINKALVIVNQLIWNTDTTPDNWINNRISPKGLTALYKALRESHPSRLIQPMLDAGADPTIKT